MPGIARKAQQGWRTDATPVDAVSGWVEEPQTPTPKAVDPYAEERELNRSRVWTAFYLAMICFTVLAYGFITH